MIAWPPFWHVQSFGRTLRCAEGGLVLFKAKAPQPACHVHDGAQTKALRYIIVLAKDRVQDTAPRRAA